MESLKKVVLVLSIILIAFLLLVPELRPTVVGCWPFLVALFFPIMMMVMMDDGDSGDLLEEKNGNMRIYDIPQRNSTGKQDS